MGVIRRLQVRTEMHCMGISNAFPMRTANLQYNIALYNNLH